MRLSGITADIDVSEKVLAALDKAIANYQTASEQKNNTTDSDVRYSLNPNFEEEYDNWDKKNTNIVFNIGNTSKALQSVGIKNQQIQMRSGMIIQKVNKHQEMTFDIFKQIPKLIENPIIVQFSDALDKKTNKPKYDSRITVLGELYADMKVNGKTSKNPVLVSIELLPTNSKKTSILNVSIVTSAYAKNALQKYLNDNSILYVEPNKKRTNKWLSLNRLQLPLGETKFGSIKKITYSKGKVKIENSKNSSSMQIALEKAGAVDSFGNSIFNDNENNSSNDRFSKEVSIEDYFDDEYYYQFRNESKEKITKSISELEKEAEEFESKIDDKNDYFDEIYSRKNKIRALKAGYDNEYDYLVNKDKDRIRKYSEQYIDEVIKKQKAREKESALKKDIAESTPFKAKQFEIIQENNPPFNDTSLWIRSPKEIKTFDEVINDDESFTWGDFTKEDAEKALKKDIITVYSSYPIHQGTFVSTSYIQAQEYAGGAGNKVYSKTIKPKRVAWINGDEGQYASVTDSNIRYSKEIDNYSYKALTSKQDMNITQIDDSKTYTPNKESRKYIVEQSIENAKKNNKVNENGNAVVYVDDIDTDVIVSKSTIRHSLDRRLNKNAPVLLNVSSILKNSIRINELTPKKDTIEKSYALIGIAKNSQNEPYVVSFVVNRATNSVTSIDVLYAVNSKKEVAALNEPELSSQGDVSLTTSTISISNLLEYVNEYYPDLLSEDVLRKFGYDQRPEGELGKSALYSREVDTTDYDSLLKENKKLEKLVESLEQELLPGHHISNSALLTVTRQIKKLGNSNIDTGELGKQLKSLFEYIANDEKVTGDTAFDMARDIAKNVINDSKEKQELDAYAKEVISRIKEYKIALSEDAFGSCEVNIFVLDKIKCLMSNTHQAFFV